MIVPKRMKAVITAKYGAPDVLVMKDISVPSISATDVLIKVYAASVTFGDVRLRGAIFPKGFGTLGKLMFGFDGPKKQVLGVDFAGIIVAVGEQVTRFTVGDKVFGIDGNDMGAYAEYKRAGKNVAMSKMPENMSFEEAASLVFGGSASLGYLKHKVQIKRGDKLLINGASGAVGTASVQIAKHFGAIVTAVCSKKNAALVTSLGADSVVDYSEQNVSDLTESFDIILDAVRNLTYKDIKSIMNPKGKFLALAGGLDTMLSSLTNGAIIAGEAGERSSDMELLKDFAEAGVIVPVIDKVYDFADIQQAHAYVEKGHKIGNVILRIH
jgi:NADPH:quinone reductase-like Zn-dependent oxidoreductase